MSDTALLRAHRAAKTSLDSFSRVTRLHGSLIQSWATGASIVAPEHHPRGGVVDRRRLHLFWHATRSGRRRYLGTSGVPCQEEWKRSPPSHRVAIGLDARGLPVSIFSVNHWVTDGHWFDADTTLGNVSALRAERNHRPRRLMRLADCLRAKCRGLAPVP